jgi:hypothetical protein
MLYLIEADVAVRVRGISGPFIKNVSYLVNADNREQARVKYEKRVAQDHANMIPEKIEFDYKKVAEEVK